MKIPEVPTSGQPVSADWGADVVRYLKALTARPSATVKPSMGPGGTTYRAAGSRPAGVKANTSQLPPWWPTVKQVDVEGTTQAQIHFQPATVNNVPPSVPPADSTSQYIGGVAGYLVPPTTGDGVIAVKCEFESAYEETHDCTIDVYPAGAPADDVPYDMQSSGFFHIVTHLYYHDDTGQLRVRPVYFQSIRTVRYGRVWRW
jgi:hypothetical protein